MLEQLLDASGQVWVAQLGAGKVDRQRAEGLVVLFPGLHLSAGLLQNPVTELENGAILFRQVDEVLWWHLPKGWVAPADQRLGAYQLLGLEAELGLEAQAHFVAFDGAAQFMLQGDALAGLGGEIAGVGFDAVAAFGLGAVHGGVGVADQCGNVGAVLWIQADADAGAGEELVFTGLERRGETGQQLVGDGTGVAGLVQAG